MIDTILAKRFTKLINDAQKVNEQGLKALREKILTAVGKFGARRFVTVTSEVLKDNFRIEGCNDVRVPLKRIFDISLEELETKLLNYKYSLPVDHPISLLSVDHKDILAKLKKLRLDLGRLNLNSQTPAEKITDKLNQANGYYQELDSHIRKEEEVLFPVLENSGMQEHPENLREEHKKFKDSLSNIIKLLDKMQKGLDSQIEIDKIAQAFILAICNHIFRETYIFYPAALEFITDTNQWEKIKEGFKNIS